MQLTKNFHLDEFACHDGTPVPAAFVPNAQRLADNLQVLRDELNMPVTVVSGYRTPAHNRKVRGAKRSEHLDASAGDVKVVNLAPEIVHLTILRLIAEGRMEEGGLGLYDGWVHYDVRGRKARWRG